MKIEKISGTKKKYLNVKFDELETYTKNENIRDLFWGINGYKNGYQPRNNIVKDNKGDWATHLHCTWRMEAIISLRY